MELVRKEKKKVKGPKDEEKKSSARNTTKIGFIYVTEAFKSIKNEKGEK